LRASARAIGAGMMIASPCSDSNQIQGSNMKNATRSFAIGAALALLPLGAAFAQTPAQDPGTPDSTQSAPQSTPQDSQPAQQSRGTSFESLDTNGDGKISKAEAAASASVSAQFSRYDVNGDGFIERAEVNASNQGSQTTPPKE
jgi:hypothetical protein